MGSPSWVELVSTLLHSRQLVHRFSRFLVPELIGDRDVWEVLQAGIEHVRKYSSAPSESDLKMHLYTSQNAVKIISRVFECKPLTESYAQDLVLERVRAFLLRNIVKDAAESIDRGRVDYDHIYRNMRSLILDLESTSSEIILPKDVDEALNLALEHALIERVPIGIRGVDRLLGGGVGRGELSFLIAPPGRGKTANLINFFYNSLSAFKNTLFVSLEMNIESILERFFRRSTLQLRKELIEDQNTTRSIFQGWLGATGAKAVLVFQKRGQFSVQDLEFLIDRIRVSEGIDIQVVVLDYMQRMQMSGKGEYRLRIRDTVEDLRALSQERRIVTHTGSQMNREALKSEDPSEAHVSESFAQAESADIMMMFSQTNEEVTAGEGHFTLLKVRDGQGRGMRVPVVVELDRMLVSDDPQVTGRGNAAEENEVEGINFG